MEKSKLIFGDNLEQMRQLNAEGIKVDLICTDPPFNSGEVWNIPLPISKAQRQVFNDTWKLNGQFDAVRKEIHANDINNPVSKHPDKDYRNLDIVLRNLDPVLDLTDPFGAMKSYLTYMGIRLVEMRRLLKEDGSIYLHCDPTASHYLKIIMDSIFGKENFQNEIIWSYNSAGGTKKRYGRKHDILFFYSKNKIFTFNYNDLRTPYSADIRIKDQEKFHPLGKLSGDVFTIPILSTSSKERVGYPTQKPVALYERMILASSNPNDIILDPFCGSGTTLDAAQKHDRKWIGVEVTNFAYGVLTQRLKENHNLEPSKDYEVIGRPTNMEELYRLRDTGIDHNKRQIEEFAVTELGLYPTGSIPIDGERNFKYDENKYVTVIAEVKSGNTGIGDIRKFSDLMEEKNADLGIFITIDKEPSKNMKRKATEKGNFEYNGDYTPRLQFWNITSDYFNDKTKKPKFPKEITQMTLEDVFDIIL